jgi:hypothetical protein
MECNCNFVKDCIKNEFGIPIFNLEYCEQCYKINKYELLECCHNPNVIQIHTQFANDTIHKRNFCKNCYKIFKTHKKVPGEKLYFLDKYRTEKARELYNNYRDQYSKRWSDIYKLQHRFQVQSWNEKYEKYLNSNEWKELRQRILNRDKYICQICKTNKAVQVHHLTYKRLGNEQDFDLISVCLPCHELEHTKQ